MERSETRPLSDAIIFVGWRDIEWIDGVRGYRASLTTPTGAEVAASLDSDPVMSWWSMGAVLERDGDGAREDGNEREQ